MTIPNMLLVGSTARNTGKTTFCAEFIRKWHGRFDIVGVKITTIHNENRQCHHGDNGCGACTSFDGDCEVIEELCTSGNKDTSGLLQAGAAKVYWVKAKKRGLGEAAGRFMAVVPNNAIVVCESNSLSKIVTPGVTVVTHRSGVDEIKPSSEPMLKKADFIVDVGDSDSLNTALDSIRVESLGNGIQLNVDN